MMENYEELLHKLEEFERTKPKELPKELEDFMAIVAKTGDPIYPWPKIKHVYRQKIISVLQQFLETSPSIDTTQFCYESMKAKILERFDSFRSAPFTIQRLSELLISPRKEYNRIDKYMRAIEKNILVVSVAEPGCSKHVHLNGSVEPMEEGFQVSSTSVYDEYRQRVAGIMENEVAAAAISEDGQSEILKGNGRCKRGEDDGGAGDVSKKADENGPSPISGDGDASSQGRLGANQGSLLDHQEFHRLEFSLAESDTLAIVEIVSEVDCPTAEISEESTKDYPLGTSLVDNSSGVTDSVVSPVISDSDSCDTVTEVVATDTSGSVPIDDELASSEKASSSDHDSDENQCSAASSSKEAPPHIDLESNAKLDCQNIDVMDIGASGDAQPKGESDSASLSNSTKVLVISSPGSSEFPENMNSNAMCNLEATDKSKNEINYLVTNKNESASEKPCDVVEGNDMVTVDHSEPVSVKSPLESSSKPESRPSMGRTSPVVVCNEDDSSNYKEELISSDKKDNDS